MHQLQVRLVSCNVSVGSSRGFIIQVIHNSRTSVAYKHRITLLSILVVHCQARNPQTLDTELNNLLNSCILLSLAQAADIVSLVHLSQLLQKTVCISASVTQVFLRLCV